MIEIAFLVDHPKAISTLTQWFRGQWPEYYAAHTPADIAQDFHAEANRDGLPVRLLAFADGVLAGTVTLREQAFRAMPEYQPGIGGLFVAEQHRGRGIGTELVRAGMKLAQEQGYETVYIATVTACGIVEHLGWGLVQAVTHGDEQTVIYRYDLEKRGPTCIAADRFAREIVPLNRARQPH
jgi:GNAT superfamily N-acetyltransferase